MQGSAARATGSVGLPHTVGARDDTILAGRAARPSGPIDVTRFGSTIRKSRGAAPDIDMSVLVVNGHLGFHRQRVAAGMKSKIAMAPTTFGAAETEPVIMTPEAADGIPTCSGSCHTIDNPVNRAAPEKVTSRHPTDTPLLAELSACSREGMTIWADAVKMAGSLDRMR